MEMYQASNNPTIIACLPLLRNLRDTILADDISLDEVEFFYQILHIRTWATADRRRGVRCIAEVHSMELGDNRPELAPD